MRHPERWATGILVPGAAAGFMPWIISTINKQPPPSGAEVVACAGRLGVGQTVLADGDLPEPCRDFTYAFYGATNEATSGTSMSRKERQFWSVPSPAVFRDRALRGKPNPPFSIELAFAGMCLGAAGGFIVDTRSKKEFQ